MEMLTLNVKARDGLGLTEAFALISGMLPFEALSDEKKQCITGAPDSPAAQINLERDEEYAIESPLMALRPCEINGNGAVVKGCGSIGMLVMSSNVSISNVHFDNHQMAVSVIGQMGAILENISLCRCVFTNCAQMALSVGSTASNGIIRGLSIDKCEFIGSENAFDDSTGGSCMVLLSAASIVGDEPVNNCILDNVSITNCHFHGKYRMAVQFFCGAGTGLLSGNSPDCHGNEIRNVKITDNVMENSFDATINVIAATMNQTNASVHDLLIARNRIIQGIWAIYLTGCEPVFGSCDNSKVYNVEIADNEISPVEHVGEITFGIAIQSGRVDYFDNTVCTNGGVESIKMHGNKLKNLNRGIFITASNILFDASGNLVEKCYARDIELYDNELTDVEEAFVIVGAFHEGRRVDWQIGWPPHEKTWGELLDDDSAVTCRTIGNCVSNVRVHGNSIDGYRYRCRVAGLYGFGQGVGTGNCCANIAFEGNSYTRGEGRLSVNDTKIDDRLHDGGENTVSGFSIK